MKIKTLTNAIALAGLTCFTSHNSFADGQWEGMVLDGSNLQPINGSVVSIKALNRDVLVNRAGRFRLNQLKAGTYHVTVRLADETLHTQSIVIEDQQTLSKNLIITAQEESIEEIVVVGQAAQMQRAIDRQRFSDNMVSAINADAIGQLPDDNAAEALQRVPGLSIERDQGEGRFVRVRGISPDLNAVTVNGTQLPAPEAGRRAVALDVMPSDLISSMTVTKTLTPDMDANAIGGSIEVESLSALDRADAFYTIRSEASYEEHTEKTNPSIAFTAGNAFELPNAQRLGVAAALSYDQRKFGSNNVETGGAWDFDEDPAALEELEQRDYTIERTRIGAALNFDYDISTNDRLYLRTLYSQFTDDEQRQSSKIEFGKLALNDELELEFDGSARQAGDTGLAEVKRELKDREETQEILSTTFGGEHFIQDWTLSYALGYSEAKEDEPGGIAGAVFKQEELDGIGFTNTKKPTMITSNDYFNAAAYELDEVEYTEASTKDTQVSAKFDITRDLYINDYPAIMKFGGKSLSRKKHQEENVYIYDDFGAADDTLIDYQGPTANYNINEFGPTVSSDDINSLLASLDKSAAYQEEDSKLATYDIKESVNAAYVMGRIDIDQLRILTGVRYEDTQTKFDGVRYDGQADQFTPLKKETDFDHLLPSLHVRYELNDNMQLRAAYTQAVVRPTFEQMAPSFSDTEDDGDKEASLGNSDLKSLESSNVDLGFEFFTGNAGLISAFYFRKDIDNFIYETDLAGSPEWADYDEVATFVNGDKATLNGFELAYSQKMAFLPYPLNGLLISANASFIESDALISTYDDGDLVEREISLPNQSDVTGNFIVGYEQGQWMLRIAANYKSEYLLEVNDITTHLYDVYQAAQTQLDFSMSYNILDNMKVSFDIANLTDEPYYTYVNSEAYNSQYEDYGTRYRLGLTISQF
ncbi:TonB-dependent receptor [Oceaniserpentilla sp. 4NH20-0058]|uniref:TonB-dependent receptor n=1 Tax=Oceaniserpentilla sp. 4NH20-0058 TaxID=3127660 RepID=UPI00310BF2AF